MAELIDVVNCFSKKAGWEKLSDKDKSDLFFIVNRYMSKKYPSEAQLLNLKSIDKISSMDIWFHFMKTQPYPKWFWSKSSNIKEKESLKEKEIILLMKFLKVKRDDILYLIDNNIEFLKQELKYLNSIEK
jgi:hypothetical protein